MSKPKDFCNFIRPRGSLSVIKAPLSKIVLVFCALSVLLVMAGRARAVDLSKGLIYAVPVPNGKAPGFTGRESDWDLTGAEPFWVADQTAKHMNASVAVEYDDTNLYFFAKVYIPRDKLINDKSPAEPFWAGDMMEMRLASDPALPYPLPGSNDRRVTDSPRICHLSVWKNTNTGKTYLHIAYGGTLKAGSAVNPPGSRVVVTEFKGGYIAETQIPWSALNAPGGKNPFSPGQRMTVIFGAHWNYNGFFAGSSGVYNTNPGDFAFLSLQDWGQAEFSVKGNLPPHHDTMEQALAKAAAASAATPVGVPITVQVPAAGKISVNIFGEHGEVIRELAGGESVRPGKFTVYWNGYDQWGFPAEPGAYKWGAYLSGGLKARYIGMVGTSGNPPYPTEDGKGGWGGDHGVPTTVAADMTGLYFGWVGAEAAKTICKVDYAGHTLWRKSPFVTGSLYALTSNKKYLYCAYSGSGSRPEISRVDAISGVFAPFDYPATHGITVPVYSYADGRVPRIEAPEGGLPLDDFRRRDGGTPECLGLAANDREIFASVYSQNLLQVLDAETGKPTRSLSVPRPRGLALDGSGNLYVVSYGSSETPRVYRFDSAQGQGRVVVTSGMVAPMGVAIDAHGNIAVTDEGASQQVKIFSPGGKLLRTIGKEGGRPWTGTYDPGAFLWPSGIASDPRGGLDVVESAIPKIIDRIDPSTGKNLSRWFGYPSYGVSNVPDSDDPLTNYYPFEPSGIARATVPASGGNGYPTAYWDFAKVGGFGPYAKSSMDLPFVRTLKNGKKYFIEDTSPHYVCLIEGDQLLPVGRVNIHSRHRGGRDSVPDFYDEIWIDRNGNHQADPDESLQVETIEGKPAPFAAGGGNTVWLDDDGSAYLLTQENNIVKIPSDGFLPSGAINWNPAKASFVVPTVVPSHFNALSIGYREGLSGVRVDSKGNVYTALEATIPALTPSLQEKIEKQYPDLPRSDWWVYANADLAKQMHEGLGHTAQNNVIKFAKFGPDGKPLWIAGRKATAAAHPGEIYHFWTTGGMVGDDYFAAVSEWGLFYFYTSDGFYVDAIMNDPATLPPAGPYTFGSETFSGRITAFPKLGKVYAYQEGGVYAVDGFNHDLKVNGEKRIYGTVALDKTYGASGATASGGPSGLEISPLVGDPTSAATWASLPVSNVVRTGAQLATAQIGYTAHTLYARVHVIDNTPLQNVADDPTLVFKGGDVVGLDLGPAGDRNAPGAGDIRILAASMHGQARLIAMKPLSGLAKQPQEYTTPASGTKHFDFVGDIPGGKAVLTPDADGKGYTAILAIPRGFLEYPLFPGTALKGDIEVLLSGAGAQGTMSASRNWLFSGGHVETTMIDDIPTEAWLYPQFWGDISVK